MTLENTLRDDRIGEVSYTKYGTKAILLEYINRHKILVEFQDKYRFKYYTSYSNFKNKSLTNPYECRFKNGIGFIGIGKYNSKDHKIPYSKWKAILHRCTCNDYDAKNNESIASYKDCTVCDEWLNFQNFASWFYENLYECDEELCVDKDILFHGNKIYSPDTCLLVPERINLLLVKEKSNRGNYPIGVYKPKSRNRYIASMSTLEGKQYIGSYLTADMAFSAYKTEKEKYIKNTAVTYKDKIPSKVFNAVYNYEILIID